MIKQEDRYANAMNSILTKLKLGDKCHAEVHGPQLAMFRDQQGRPVPDMGYVAMVVLDHNRLIGQDPIAVLVNIRGLLPNTQAFEQATGPLLEECRKLRDKANNPAPSVDEAKAVVADAEREREIAFRKTLPKIERKKEVERRPRERESHFS